MDSEIVILCEKINKSIERLASLHVVGTVGTMELLPESPTTVASPAWWEEPMKLEEQEKEKKELLKDKNVLIRMSWRGLGSQEVSSELAGMKRGDLEMRARSVGMDQQVIDDASDAKIIKFILTAELKPPPPAELSRRFVAGQEKWGVFSDENRSILPSILSLEFPSFDNLIKSIERICGTPKHYARLAAGVELEALRKRALAAGVDLATIENAIDEAEDPKASLAELIAGGEGAPRLPNITLSGDLEYSYYQQKNIIPRKETETRPAAPTNFPESHESVFMLAIIIVQDSNNPYEAELAADDLSVKLSKLGFDCEIISGFRMTLKKKYGEKYKIQTTIDELMKLEKEEDGRTKLEDCLLTWASGGQVPPIPTEREYEEQLRRVLPMMDRETTDKMEKPSALKRRARALGAAEAEIEEAEEAEDRKAAMVELVLKHELKQYKEKYKFHKSQIHLLSRYFRTTFSPVLSYAQSPAAKELRKKLGLDNKKWPLSDDEWKRGKDKEEYGLVREYSKRNTIVFVAFIGDIYTVNFGEKYDEGEPRSGGFGKWSIDTPADQWTLRRAQLLSPEYLKTYEQGKTEFAIPYNSADDHKDQLMSLGYLDDGGGITKKNIIYDKSEFYNNVAATIVWYGQTLTPDQDSIMRETYSKMEDQRKKEWEEYMKMRDDLNIELRIKLAEQGKLKPGEEGYE